MKRHFSSKAKQVLSSIAKKPNVEPRPSLLSTFNHGYYRRDDYMQIRYDSSWQSRIIKREDEIYDRWNTKLLQQ